MIDRYTKIILTVIAVCLVALVVQNVIKPAHAQYARIYRHSGFPNDLKADS
jgi:Zn-dependent membrane protease YugP